MKTIIKSLIAWSVGIWGNIVCVHVIVSERAECGTRAMLRRLPACPLRTTHRIGSGNYSKERRTDSLSPLFLR